MINDGNRKWWVVAAMGMILVLLNIDRSGLPIALPAIGRNLDMSTAGLQWTLNAYVLALAALSLAAGRLADIFGRKKVVLIGTAVFILGSAAAGLAQSDGWLVASRVIQGLGAAGVFATSLSVVSNAFPEEEQGRGIAAWATIGGIGLSISPLLVGTLTNVLSWRWVFFVNVPIALVAMLLTLTAVRESRDETAGRHVDLIGLVSLIGGLTALVFALQQGSLSGWGSAPVLGSLVAAAVLLGFFILVEPRVHEPLIELGLFTSRGYLGANAVAASNSFVVGALLFLLTLYLQNVLGLSALSTGVVFIAYTVAVVIFEAASGTAGEKFGFTIPMAGGMALMAAGFFVLALVTPTSGVSIVIVAISITGIGMGLSFTISTTSGMANVSRAKAGAASGILTLGRLIATAFGVAAAGGLFKTLENYKLSQLLRDAGANLGSTERTEIRALLSGSQGAEAGLARLAPEASSQVESVVNQAFVYGFSGAMLLCALVSVVGVLAAFLVPPRAPGSQ